ncbi:hypothetical protein [Parasitella parasitica]|uniref:Uncharacterized protein n=1 Tax=Parasitella parasitica TaxID=35722 RepID=A0A0B7MZ76_9FUNG|nr:hypothetical protein [Parasitella parasitica]
MSYYICNRLEEAIGKCGPTQSVWAIDVLRNYSGAVRQGKSFIVADRVDMYRKMLLYRKPTCYEVIVGGSSVYFYLDIEITLSEDDARFTFPSIHRKIMLLKTMLIKHLDLSFNNIEHENNRIIMQACTLSKFFIHILHRGVIFQDHSCSCAAYVAEFAAYVKNEIFHGIVRHTDETENEDVEMLRAKSRLRNYPAFIDQSVYKRSRQFRTLGSSKILKNRPLILYTGVLTQWSERTGDWFNMTNFDYSTWARTLVVVNDPLSMPVMVVPNEHIPLIAVSRAYNRLYRGSPNDDMLISGRFFIPTCSTSSTRNSDPTSSTSSTSTNSTSNNNSIGVINQLKNTIMLPTIQKGLTSIIDDAV